MGGLESHLDIIKSEVMYICFSGVGGCWQKAIDASSI